MNLSASILSADFANLESEVARAEEANVDMLHIDVADGVFVPNLTVGAPVVRALRSKTELFLDVHLMIVNPEHHIESFLNAGSDLVTIHLESAKRPIPALETIKRAGRLAGIALNPETPVESLAYLLDYIDQVTLLGVVPGFGGQKLLPSTPRKACALREFLSKHGSKARIEVDGGVKAENIKLLFESGCDVAVAGSAIFGADDLKAAVHGLRLAAKE